VAFRDALPRTRTLVGAGALLAAGVVLFLAFFYAFGGWSLSAPADLTLCNGDEPQTLDPAIVTGQLEGRICLALFEGLTTRDPAGNIVPGMAERWERSADGKTYTFHLRAGIRWSNGEPVTAADFLNSWKRALEPATASEYAYQLYYLVNGEAYGTGKLTDFSQVGVKAPDGRTLVVTLNHPTAYFLELASLQTLCPVYLPCIAQYGDDWIKPGRMVCNGPYVMKEWRLNDYILLEANPQYYKPVPIRRIKVLPTRDPNTCLNLFSSGKTDLILDQTSVPSVLLPDIRRQPYYHPNPFGATTFLRFNVKRPPFNDVRVRQALALALDKQDIVDKILRDDAPVANTLVPPGNAGYVSPRGLVRDVTAAQKLLAAAGYPDGRGFPDVNLLYSTKGSAAGIATEVQALWARDLGITSIHLRGQEWKVYLNSMASVDFDIGVSRWIGDYNDPQTFIDMFTSDSGNNQTNWSNPRYDQMLAQSEAEPDPARRLQIFHDMEKLLVEDEVPIVPISFMVGSTLYRPGRLGGYEPNFVDDHRWGDLYLPGKK
jgi:oligopeptide transport system substrate-binding protein